MYQTWLFSYKCLFYDDLIVNEFGILNSKTCENNLYLTEKKIVLY